MRDVTGHCPACHVEGPVGQPCGGPSCRLRGYHFIPEDAFSRLRELPPARTDPRLGQCIGEYLLVDVLGSGGFGKVYLALQLPILMKTALKVMDRSESDPDLADALAKRFEGEAAALATLNHPNIVRLLKYGVHDGLPYLVMEFVEGNRTLRSEMQSGALAPGHADPAVVAQVLRQMLNALEAAHSRNIVHRDVKPENVMLQDVPGDRWFVKVLDFGLAKFVEERSETSLMIGTPAYMAPEQITRKNIGPWTDLYALGVLAFRLVTGRLPFQGDSTQETYALKLDPTYDPLDQVRDLGLDPELVGFLRQSMARDPESRYCSATEFRKAFEEVASRIGDSLSRKPSPVPDDRPTPTEDAVPPKGMVAPPPSLLPEPEAPAARPARPPDRQMGVSLTEQVRRVGDEAFAQVGSKSVVTTQQRRATSSQPAITERRPRRRILGTLEGLLLVLLALSAIWYLTRYGPSLEPVRQWFARAEAFLESGAPSKGGRINGQILPELTRKTVSVRVASTPGGARVHNGDTGDELGRTPVDVLVPPGGTLRLHVQMDGYRDELLTITHDEAMHQAEWPVRLVRRK